MFTVDSPNLPTTQSGSAAALLGVIGPEIENAGLLSTYSLTARTTASNIPIDFSTSEITEVSPGVFSLTTSLVGVTSISQNGIVYLPAANPSDPQDGEFVQAGGSIVIHGNLIPDLPAQLAGASETIINTGVSYIDPFLYRFPFGESEITFSVSLQGYPTGQLKLTANNAEIAGLMSTLSQKSVFSLYGYGFYVASVSISEGLQTEHPDGLYEIEISIDSIWNKRESNYPVYWNGKITSVSPVSGRDPDCDGSGSNLFPTVGRVSSKSITLQALALQNNVRIVGPPIPIPIPSNSNAYSSTQWTSEVERTKAYRSLLDYAAYSAIRIYDINSTPNWMVTGLDLLEGIQETYSVLPNTTAYLGGHQLNNAYQSVIASGENPYGFGYAVEYRNAKVDSEFVSEKQAADPNATRPPREPKRRTEIIGDSVMPSEFSGRDLKDLSMCFDAGGQSLVKTKTFITFEDEIEVERLTEYYGFAYTAKDIDDGNGGLSAFASLFWKLIKTETIVQNYDTNTGYHLGWRKTGRMLGRFKTESANDFGSRDDATGYLYEFRWLPLQGWQQKLLRLFRATYVESYNQGQVAIGKRCLPDGSSQLVAAQVRGWVHPRYVAVERVEERSFLKTANPDYSPGSDTPEFLIAGEEKSAGSEVRVFRSSKTRQKPELDAFGDNSSDFPDKYSTRTWDGTDSGAQFRDSRGTENIQVSEGRPPEADKRPLYPEDERTADEQADPNLGESQDPESYWVVRTPGQLATQPEQGSVGCPNGLTLEQTKTYIRTAYAVDDWQNVTTTQITIAFNPKIKPGDRLILTAGYRTRRRRVLSVSHALKWNGIALDGATQISCGLDRDVNLEFEQRKTQSQGDARNFDEIMSLEDIGEINDYFFGRTRRTFV